MSFADFDKGLNHPTQAIRILQSRHSLPLTQVEVGWRVPDDHQL